MSRSHLGTKICYGGLLKHGQHAVQGLIRQFVALVSEGPIEKRATEFFVFVALLQAHKPPDTRPSLAGDNKSLPSG